MNKEMLTFIKGRRSTRKYKKDCPKRELIETVIEAGRFAPSGGNNQSTHFLVITDKKVLDTLQKLVAEEFVKMEVTEGGSKLLMHAIRASKRGEYVFNYNAPVLIITANLENYGNNIADCSCALENMMLMANALDLGSCWINQLRWLKDNPVILAYLKTIGLKETERVYGALAVGFSDTLDGLPVGNPLKRIGNPVSWV